MTHPPPGRTGWWILLILVLPVSGFFLVDWGVYQLEKRDPFCVACHLHEKKYEDFQTPRSEVQTLAALHRAVKALRCIDCHKGEGVVERAGVLAIAAYDTLIYFLGMAEEPETQRFPLSDRTCLRCHEEDLAPEGSYAQDYHALTAHVDLPVRCPECHVVHKPGNPEEDFLIVEVVRPVCERCHPGMFEGY